MLGRRLLLVTLGLTALAVLFLASGLGVGPNRAWWVFGPCGVAVLGGLLVVRTSERVRAVGVVAVLVTASLIGYTRFGHTPGPALALALAAVIAGLLLGRRAMYATVAVAMMGVAVVGTLMVRGHIDPPPEGELSPLLARVWIRTTIFTVLVTFILAAVVTWVVERVELSAARAQRERERRHEVERQALEAQHIELVGQVAGGLAHDINNHLAVISMWSSVLLASRTQDDVEEATDEINAAIEQATALTRRVLVLGRRGVRSPKPLSLCALVDEQVGTLRRVVGKSTALEVDHGDDAWCQADEAQLGQALLNLVMNARDALPDGGTVTVRTGRRERAGAGTAFLEVVDTGKGMTDEVRRRATEPFFSTKPPGKGSGLGLASVLAIARQSDGELELTSKVGEGTTATLYLPAIAGPARAPAAAVPAVAPLVTARVLLVDDSPALVQVSRRTLQDAGCTVVVAADGDEAMQRIGEGRFDVLCSDVVMPGRAIAEVLAAFEQANPGAPVLLCSGYVGEELVRRGIEEGLYRFLAKPYGPGQLIAEVASLVREAALGPRAPSATIG